MWIRGFRRRLTGDYKIVNEDITWWKRNNIINHITDVSTYEKIFTVKQILNLGYILQEERKFI
jgi:hypothetical protein